jgi:hypothetical protein
MIEGLVELVDGVRPERVAYVRPVEGDPDHPGANGTVIADVAEREAWNGVPELGIEGPSHKPKRSGAVPRAGDRTALPVPLAPGQRADIGSSRPPGSHVTWDADTCTQFAYAVHGVQAMYSARNPRYVGCPQPVPALAGRPGQGMI